MRKLIKMMDLYLHDMKTSSLKINFALFVVMLLASTIFLGAGCAAYLEYPENSPERLYYDAAEKLSKHEFETAHRNYSSLIEKHPRWKHADEALYKKGYLEVYLNRYDDAQKSFEALVKDYPKSVWRFDASMWGGLLGEHNVCVATEKKLKDAAKKTTPKVQPKDSKELTDKIEKLESENIELRRQIKALREILEK